MKDTRVLRAKEESLRELSAAYGFAAGALQTPYEQGFGGWVLRRLYRRLYRLSRKAQDQAEAIASKLEAIENPSQALEF
jgi:hypothetical protein